MSTEISKKIEKKFFIGNNLKRLRNNKLLTVEECSKQINFNLKTYKNYEASLIYPSINNLIILSNFFSVSIDYIIHGEQNNYINSILFVNLAQLIDKLDQVKRFQIENTINTLIKNIEPIKTMFDDDNISLSNNFNQNIKIIREKKEISQQIIADYLNIKQSVVSRYEKSTMPSIDSLVKLSKLFNISIHSLVTGEKLLFNFKNLSLKEAILNGDKLLQPKDKEFITNLMQKIIDDSSP